MSFASASQADVMFLSHVSEKSTHTHIPDPALPISWRQLVMRSVASARAMTTAQAIMVAGLVITLLVGNVGQIVTLNMWLSWFNAQSAAPFTVLTFTSVFFSTFYLIILAGYCIAKRPDLSWFIATPIPIAMCCVMGCCISLNGVLIVSATPHTPEILQAMLISTTPFWTFGLQRLLVKSASRGHHLFVLVAFLFTTAGILVGSASAFKKTGFDTSKIWWTVIFAISIIPAAMYNVMQMKYMTRFTLEKDEAEGGQRQGAVDSEVKAVMLATSCIFQLIFMFVFFPVDALPWFGTASTYADAWVALSAGWKCVFNCEHNLLYAILFSCSYILVYTSSVYLNHYSATVCSIVTQLSSPLCALVLLIVPAWNVGGASYYVGPSVGAILLIVVGALMYTAWEEATKPIPDALDLLQDATAQVQGDVYVPVAKSDTYGTV